MTESKTPAALHSPLASLIEAFLEDKRSRGYRYRREQQHLLQLDRFLVEMGHVEVTLPRDIVEGWLARSAHLRPSTHRHRRGLVSQLAAFLALREYSAYSPPRPPKTTNGYSTARVFSRDEIRRILDAADRLSPQAASPLRHVVMPELFRVLYGCGLRVGESVRLTVADVDLAAGILRIREGKSRRDRLVPVAPKLRQRLETYAAQLGPREPEASFFPSPRGGFYQPQSIYWVFRRLLESARIAHRGRGQGPRLHEVRHAFAIHRLERWYRDGEDLNVKLPLLATYMGHRSMAGTQWYLQLTRALFTDLASRLERTFGHVIPRETRS
jgi:integrase/recombinase XerD